MSTSRATFLDCASINGLVTRPVQRGSPRAGDRARSERVEARRGTGKGGGGTRALQRPWSSSSSSSSSSSRSRSRSGSSSLSSRSSNHARCQRPSASTPPIASSSHRAAVSKCSDGVSTPHTRLRPTRSRSRSRGCASASCSPSWARARASLELSSRRSRRSSTRADLCSSGELSPHQFSRTAHAV